jgi:serine/threonine-protein kinase
MSLTPERWQQVKEILDAALARERDQRALFLEEACDQDPVLRQEVDSLLASAHIGEALERPLVDAPSILFGSEEEGGGRLSLPSELESSSPIERHIGPYRLVKELGRGGMGDVYLAARDDDHFKKRVAIKILRPGMDFGDIVRRFRNERQILASIDHPHIARLLDGGSTEDGLPYFVMEYVDGKPIDEYCDTHRLSIADRLGLFGQVCAAVHFAHQNLVIHRDLKPGNILVTPDGVPKLLDFGIAKLLNPELVSGPIDPTQFDRRLMTPEYASPEQVRGESVTTASDVYSMGVLLYELLTGHRPYRLKDRQLHEITHAVCEVEPTRPSAVIDLVEEVPGPRGTSRRITPEGVSSTREGTRERLRRRLKGDLDNICLMSMRKEPRRRYGSVEQLSEDIGRVLEGLPVRARKPTFSYRSSKFVRRHKLSVAATVVFLLSIVAFSTTIVRERNRAEKEAAKAEAISRFLLSTLQSADPMAGGRRDVTVVEALDEAVKKIEPSFSGEPEIKAELEYTIGTTYYHLGRYDDALRLLRSSVATLESTVGDDDPNLANALEALAQARGAQGDNEEAASLLERVVAIREKNLDSMDPVVARALDNLATVYRAQGKYEQAEKVYQRSLRINEKVMGSEDASVAATLNNIAALYAAQGRSAEAEPLLRRSLEISEKALGSDHPRVATALANLGAVKVDQGSYAEAEPLLLRALSLGERVLGAEHPSVAKTINNLGGLYVEESRYSEAEPLLRRSLEIAERSRGPEHLSVAIALNNLAGLYLKQGRTAEAEPLFWRSLRIAENALGSEDLFVARLLNNLGELRGRQARYAEGERLCERALDIRRKALEPDHLDVGSSLENLAGLLADQGRPTEAEPLYTQALAIYERALGPEHPDSKEIREALAELRAPQAPVK